ncbi:HAD domain-containing protein [Paenibacillus kobensis]|uniref:HAD domain-containing protein n=1 Tax=Paenibacillus kobensis TaxID=59841 RepID=UPI000FDB9959|nr:HAD domain-containing protein [Paenibacillus kobensis]
MRIIFLDIDGVLNTDRAVRLRQLHEQADINFDAEAMKNLQELIDATDAYVVISSTWRIHYNTENRLWTELIRNFMQYGLEHRIIGITPVLDSNLQPSTRWREIESWLRNYLDGHIQSFVIVDDEWEMGPYTRTHFLKCQGYRGITTEVKDKAIQILGTVRDK